MYIIMLILVVAMVVTITGVDFWMERDPKEVDENAAICPTCGARVTIKENTWECGWCRDCGVVRKK